MSRDIWRFFFSNLYFEEVVGEGEEYNGRENGTIEGLTTGRAEGKTGVVIEGLTLLLWRLNGSYWDATTIKDEMLWKIQIMNYLWGYLNVL